MAESKSLLAHLTPSFYRPIEDRGTDGLAYILNKSAACRGALDGLLRDGEFRPQSISRVETQVMDDSRSRPDMVGYDKDGKRRLMVEAKFWAPLQPCQGPRYLKSSTMMVQASCCSSLRKAAWSFSRLKSRTSSKAASRTLRLSQSRPLIGLNARELFTRTDRLCWSAGSCYWIEWLGSSVTLRLGPISISFEVLSKSKMNERSRLSPQMRQQTTLRTGTPTTAS